MILVNDNYPFKSLPEERHTSYLLDEYRRGDQPRCSSIESSLDPRHADSNMLVWQEFQDVRHLLGSLASCWAYTVLPFRVVR